MLFPFRKGRGGMGKNNRGGGLPPPHRPAGGRVGRARAKFTRPRGMGGGLPCRERGGYGYAKFAPVILYGGLCCRCARTAAGKFRGCSHL